MLPALYGQIAAVQSAVALNDPIVQAATAAVALANSAAVSTADSSTTATGSRDTTYTKIFVGGLPYHTTDKTLHDYFKQFGEIEEAVVITDRQTQKSRGYGFVTMKERADAEKACKDPNPIIDGRKANVNLAYLGAKPRNNVQLAALSSTLQQLPLQAQLQAAAMMPGRLGTLPPQLYFPGAAATAAAAQSALLNNVQLANLQPSLVAAAMAQAQAQQSLVAVSQAATAHQHQSPTSYLDYLLSLNGGAATAAYAPTMLQTMPVGSSASGLEQYGYQALGVIPNGGSSASSVSNNSIAAQLNAAQQLAVAASGTGHTSSDNRRI